MCSSGCPLRVQSRVAHLPGRLALFLESAILTPRVTDFPRRRSAKHILHLLLCATARHKIQTASAITTAPTAINLNVGAYALPTSAMDSSHRMFREQRRAVDRDYDQGDYAEGGEGDHRSTTSPLIFFFSLESRDPGKRDFLRMPRCLSFPRLAFAIIGMSRLVVLTL